MASVFFKRGKWWARIKGEKHPNKWSSHPTTEKTKEDALRFAKAAQRAIDKRRGLRTPDVITLREWIGVWLERRKEAGHDWKKDRGRLQKHVLPTLGGVDLQDVTTAHVAEIVHTLRFVTKLAQRTVRNVYSVLAAAMRDAAVAGKIRLSPCILTEAHLGSVVDKDPEWRQSALFTREETETLISDQRIPLDRRVVYALGLLAGLRIGEGAALRWRHYDATRGPLGCLTIALAYATNQSKTKRTKTHSVRHVPVHPVLAEMLTEWRAASSWGTEPDDLVVPLPPDVKRTSRTGERFRGWDYTGRRWRDIDIQALGWRGRSVYDSRATFITLALDDGADPDIIEQRVTHTKPRRKAFDGYDRGERWAETCREVGKLRILRLVTTMLPQEAIVAKSKGKQSLRRRVSKAQSGPPGLRVIQGGREVIPTACDLMMHHWSQGVTTSADDDEAVAQ